MRFAFILISACMIVPLSSAQGNCSDGTTGVIVSISHTEISQDGSQFTACFSLEGDPAEVFSALFAQVVYNPDGIHPDFNSPPIIPDGSPFPTAGYVTDVSYCLGGPELCPDYLLQVYRPSNEPPFIPLPAEPVEFVCVVHDIQDPSETAGMDVLFVDAVDGEINPIPVCPDEDQGYYDGPLPVELLSFGATVNGTDIILDWETASETNNAGFEVQIRNGEDWDVLSFVEGHGTTTEAQAYGYTATDLGVGTRTFRLKQIDFDGAFEHLGEVEATIETPGTHLISSAYPNPFNPQSQFTLAVARRQHVTAEIFNPLGQRIAVLFAGTIEANQIQNVMIDGAGLPSGMYIVRVNGERFTDAFSVTLLR